MTSRKVRQAQSPPAPRKPVYKRPRIDSLEAAAVVRALGTAQAIGASGADPAEELLPTPAKKGKKRRRG